MKFTWIGQAGLLVEHNGKKIMIDPYLSDGVKKVNPKNYRRVPVNEALFDIKLDMIIITHDHLDHLDPETMEVLLAKNENLTVLAPYNAWQKARVYGNDHNYVMFERHTQWTEFGLTFKAVRACHSDLTAVGVIIDDGNKKYYIAGDTLYNDEILEDLPADIDTAFLPVNGVGNNMNMTDAAILAEKIGCKHTVPVHIGMFDELTADAFNCPTKVVPTLYEEIKL